MFCHEWQISATNRKVAYILEKQLRVLMAQENETKNDSLLKYEPKWLKIIIQKLREKGAKLNEGA